MRETVRWHRVVGAAVSLLLAGASTASVAGPQNGSGSDGAQEPPEHRATPKIIADVAALVPGTTAHLLVSFEISPHWHMYWNGQNDTGLPATWKPVNWPDGFALGRAGWPGPKRLILAGGIRDHVYEGTFGVVVELNVPKTATPGTQVTLPLHLEWMVCDRVCVLEEQDLSVTLSVVEAGAAAKPSEQAKLIEAARSRLPRGGALASEPVSRVKVEAHGATVRFKVSGAVEMEFFPAADGSEPVEPIAGTAAKGGELSVTFDGPTAAFKAIGIVAWRSAENGSWEYDWVDGGSTAKNSTDETVPAQSSPTR